ncbi:hypothetical protein JCM15519_25480 [Fundidesulfovibrio butyratiphilus]
MRKWIAFLCVAVALCVVFAADGGMAKSTKTDKTSSRKTQTSEKSSSKKTSSKKKSKASSSRASAKVDKETSSPRKGKRKSEQAKSRSKKERRQARAVSRTPASYKGEFQVETKASLLMDMKTGRVLFAQEPDLPIAPASLTKVLTLYLINEYIQQGKLQPDTVIPVTYDASHAGGSSMHLRTGENVVLSDLIKGIAIVSANDGCVAVAQYLGHGDVSPFVAAMNEKAKALGMTNTHFFNPNGLPADGQVTTARDMAQLAREYLTRFPELLAIHSMTEFTWKNRVRHNSNTLLGRVEGVDGLKTGFVCSSGFNIITTAKRGNTRLVAVVLGARTRGIRQREATRLLEEGFKIIEAETHDGKQMAMAH